MMHEHFSLSNKTIVLSGITGSLGQALVHELVKEKPRQIVGIDHNAEALEKLQDECKKKGVDLNPVICDLSEADQRKALFKKLNSQASIDVWINNAGVSGLGPFDEIGLETFNKVMQVNFHAVVDSCYFALEHMLAHGLGCIVNIASVAGLVPAPYMSAYCASKHALVGFTRSLQAEWALEDYHVRLILAAPGFFKSSMTKGGSRYRFPDWLDFMLAHTQPVARDIVKAIKTGQREVVPTLNAKLMLTSYRFLPQLTVKSSRVLLTRSLKDIFLNRYYR